jgi:Cu(I)/Ag(I) efflux system membrane fusion protein
MNRIPLILVLLVGVVIGGAATWWFTRHSQSMPEARSDQSNEKTVLYWYDPMVPNQHFDQPGKSPFMDMQLVPKYAGAAEASAGTVSIDPRLVQNLGVRTAIAKRGTLAVNVRATGSVAFDEGAITWVQARVAGIVERLHVRTTLMKVDQGQPLLTLIAPEWTASQAEYLALRQTRTAGLDGLRAAARQRLTLLGMSEAQIRAVERSGRAQDRITIAAPHAGVIGELSVREGASVMAGTPLMRINGLDSVWINAAVPEAQMGRVKAGAKVTVELPAYPGESFQGSIDALLPDLDAATRTQTARILVPNPTGRLVPGMFAQLQIDEAANAGAGILVPTEAVIATGTRDVVIIDAGDGRFWAQEVRVGAEANGQTAVLEGLSEGDRVVLSGQFLIDSEASLIGTLARLDSNPAEDVGNATEERHSAEGVIEGINGHTWSIATDAIPSLQMGAMSMSFYHPEHLPEDEFKAGVRVRFSFFHNADGDFEIAEVAVIAQAPTP